MCTGYDSHPLAPLCMVETNVHAPRHPENMRTIAASNVAQVMVALFPA